MERKLLQQEMDNLDQKIVSYQMELIKLGLKHNALKFQEEWIEKQSQELQNQLAEAVKQKTIYQNILVPNLYRIFTITEN